VVKIESGPEMTPQKMFRAITKVASDWQYDRVSIGYPGPVVHDRPIRDPFNLGPGWVKTHFSSEFDGKPVRVMNDAAMQALGAYRDGRMLFLGLGTGLGSAMIVDGVVQAMELAHLPWKKGKTYEEYLGLVGYKRHGRQAWARQVFKAVRELREVFETDNVVLGGGNAKLLHRLPAGVRQGSNDDALKGAFLLWTTKRSLNR
jgi:polyphosphate glucokinase